MVGGVGFYRSVIVAVCDGAAAGEEIDMKTVSYIGLARRLAVLGMVAVAFGASGARAAPLADFGVLLNAGVEGFGQTLKNNVFDTATKTGDGVGTASASAGTAPAPFVAAAAHSFTDDGGDRLIAGVAQMSYFMRITGPSDGVSALSLFITAALGGSTNAGAWDARLQLSYLGGSGVPFLSKELCYNLGPCGILETTDAVAFDSAELLVQPNRVIIIDLYANAQAETVDGSMATAYVDPYFALDPAAVALGYALEFSPGIINGLPDDPNPPGGAVPEPATSALMLSALFPVGVAATRSRRSRRRR